MSEQRRPPMRFYGNTRKDATVQGFHKQLAYAQRIEIDERILMMAEAEYERHHSQTIDRLRERGGLSYSEVMSLLADALTAHAPPGALIPKTLTRRAEDSTNG